PRGRAGENEDQERGGLGREIRAVVGMGRDQLLGIDVSASDEDTGHLVVVHHPAVHHPAGRLGRGNRPQPPGPREILGPAQRSRRQRLDQRTSDAVVATADDDDHFRRRRGAALLAARPRPETEISAPFERYRAWTFSWNSSIARFSARPVRPSANTAFSWCRRASAAEILGGTSRSTTGSGVPTKGRPPATGWAGPPKGRPSGPMNVRDSSAAAASRFDATSRTVRTHSSSKRRKT